MSKNDITGDSIITKVTGDQDTYGANLEKIFGKRDFRNRPIKETPKEDEDGNSVGYPKFPTTNQLIELP